MNRNRLLLLGGAVLAAAVLAVILIVVATGGGGSSDTTTSATTASSAATLTGIPQHGITLGKPSAPATLTVFEDPQCPFCRDWNVGALPSVIDQFVRAGRVKLVYQGIEIIGPNSLTGLRAIYAAGSQNKLWQMVDALYARQGQENSGWITAAVIKEAATESHADDAAILAAMNSEAVTNELKAAAGHANAVGLRGTPTFILEKPLSAGVQLNAPLDGPGFTAALAAALQ